MKNYKKILEGVVNIINTTEKSDIGFTNICAYISENCPELAESEDDNIRKNLISYFQNEYNTNSSARFTGIKVKDIIAWLEKQGEQKPVEWSEKDENNLICIKRFLHEALLDTNKSKLIYLLDWLDAHYHQKQWKPSDKQIKDLESAINDLNIMHNAVSYIDNHTKKNLTKILEQLKKLMEE